MKRRYPNLIFKKEGKMAFEQAREQCGVWDEELMDCDDDFPAECPFHEECKKDAESEE